MNGRCVATTGRPKLADSLESVFRRQHPRRDRKPPRQRRVVQHQGPQGEEQFHRRHPKRTGEEQTRCAGPCSRSPRSGTTPGALAAQNRPKGEDERRGSAIVAFRSAKVATTIIPDPISPTVGAICFPPRGGDQENRGAVARQVPPPVSNGVAEVLGELFDPEADIGLSEHFRPHWSQAGAIVFITFRTHDSIPQQVLQRWRREPQHMTEFRGTIVRLETRRRKGRAGSLSRPKHRSGDRLT